MAKSDGIPIAGRDYDDNPFYDQTAFSPPQIHNMLDKLRAGKGVGTKHVDLVEGRERSASQPPPINLRDPLVADALFPTPPPTRLEAPSHFRLPDERGNSQPNLPTTGLASPPTTLPGADHHQQQQQPPFDRMHSTPIRNAVEAEGLRGFHSAPVTPCQTPLGSRQGSPKAERRKTSGGLLGAIFGSGIYGRQTSEGAKPGLLGHLAEDNEDDVTPVGSPCQPCPSMWWSIQRRRWRRRMTVMHTTSSSLTWWVMTNQHTWSCSQRYFTAKMIKKLNRSCWMKCCWMKCSNSR